MSSAERLIEVLQAFIEKQEEEMLSWEGRSEERAEEEELRAVFREKAMRAVILEMRAVEEKVQSWMGRADRGKSRGKARRGNARTGKVNINWKFKQEATRLETATFLLICFI